MEEIAKWDEDVSRKYIEDACSRTFDELKQQLEELAKCLGLDSQNILCEKSKDSHQSQDIRVRGEYRSSSIYNKKIFYTL